MKKLDKDLLREESEHRLQDEVFGKISKTVLELLDELDRKDKEIDELNSLEKVKVSREVAKALDIQDKDDWTKQFNLIAHCKGFSGGVLMATIYKDEFEVLHTLQPLEYAKCITVGYEAKED
ncbi:hypothetical protein PP175_25330 (plasmid) [Aneurinibacillus sp. Ricciae_BoGa-3]|uniref:hypothetical protein n=1 Tax=Aneurinibacillus sp. Ricciae_BoGa-3 TaxID=3022697 RepID=UPI0023405113|nr:hypothetical protein [Aneurinibacillus sp. Ricciae_BoGa-3]WCK57392.1 hypothetical protein PP175_25330 [Aneurinibacillus sp. Ricciae_BoGa-3]